MPVRYDIAAQVPQVASGGMDPLNVMAQMRQQQYQQAQLARMAQSMDVQDQQARIAALREQRQAEAAERQSALFKTQQDEIAQKIRLEKANVYKNLFQNFVTDQKSLDSFVRMMESDFPQGVSAFKGKKFSDEWKLGLLNPEKAADLKKPIYREAGGEVYRETPQGLVPAPIVPQDLTTSLIKDREGFLEKPRYDVNAYRAGYGSDTVTRADGAVEKVRPGMTVSREDAERDLQRRLHTEFAPKAAAKVGEDVWGSLPENVRAPLTSIAYNYGTIPNRIVPAVRSGNPEAIARAIESLAGDNKGVNAGRRMQEANMARGVGLPGSEAVPAFAAGGTPSFMGGPQITPPINMMAPQAPVNTMVAQPQPQPQPQPVETVGTRKQIKGQRNIDMTLDKMLSNYERLNAAGEIVSSERAASDPIGTLGAYLKGTVVGQETQRALGSKAQDRRNAIESLRGQLLQDIKDATGMGAKELDSNFELKNMLSRLADPTMSIESVREIIANMSARYGTGKIKAPQDAAPAAAPVAAAPTSARTIVRRGTHNGRPVVEYSDGAIEYAD